MRHSGDKVSRVLIWKRPTQTWNQVLLELFGKLHGETVRAWQRAEDLCHDNMSRLYGLYEPVFMGGSELKWLLSRVYRRGEAAKDGHGLELWS